jgi:hypothetical protein
VRYTEVYFWKPDLLGDECKASLGVVKRQYISSRMAITP